MSDKPDGGPAFPCKRIEGAWTDDDGKPHVTERLYNGMSLRAYAAIHLRVPDSGTPWLGDMIRQSLRQDFAKAAMMGMLAHDRQGVTYFDDVAKHSVKHADALLAELEKKGGG